MKVQKKLKSKKGRIGTVYAISFLALTSLIVRAAYVQVVNGASFRRLESNVQYVRIPALPQRGWIYDSNGQAIAWDAPSDNIVLKTFGGNTSSQNLQIAKRLAPILHTSAATIDNNIKAHKNNLQIILASHVTNRQISFVFEHQMNLPNVQVVQTYTRQYPYGSLAGQVLGYVGSITAQNVAYYHKHGYIDTQKVGVTGLEAQYESLLQGNTGTQLLTEDPKYHTVQTVGYSPSPISGDNIQLTLDGRMQAESQKIMKNMIDSSPNKKIIKDASAVMLNVKTGGVVSMVSYPYLNPNWYASGKPITGAQAKYLTTSGAQENYAIQAPEYPGSTVKPANFITDMKHGVLTPNTQVDDKGFIHIGASIIHEDASLAFGWVNPIRAIAVSSDVFFYTMGLELAKWFGSSASSGGSYPAKDGSYQHYLDTDFIKGVNALFQGEWDFGLGPKTGIDLPNEVGGNFFIENAQKGYREVSYNLQKAEQSVQKTGEYVNHGTPEDMAFASIGQSQEFTTMQLATYAMNLANNGKKLKPHLLNKVYSAYGTPNSNAKPIKVVKPIVEGYVKAPSHGFSLLKTAMHDVTTGAVGGNYATAYGIFTSAPYQVAAKTGTSQISLNGKKALNSVFIAYAPLNKPQVALAIMIPGGGYGASLSGPIARKMFDAYFNEHHASFMPKKDWTSTKIPVSWLKSSANSLP